jgi:tRNA-splicing ligase RtcB
VDIACRMKLTVFDRKANTIAGTKDRLANVIERETRFGLGCSFKPSRDHDVMDEDWTVSPVTQRMRDKAWTQLGTSGSGNHFVEFGAFTIGAGADEPGAGYSESGSNIPPGEYLALLTHSGSRGTGAQVCQHYSRLAMDRHRELPKELKHLAWLSLDDEAGQEYWAAMNLMGHYAAANHALIHKYIARALGADVILDVENHHNFAWKERHVVDGVERELIVHRKGATPAGIGVLGIIPGSMASPGFLVRGKGQTESLASASHGAGRVMSRTKALQSFTWGAVKKLLAERDVTLLSAGLDEVPGVYKDINTVMAAQTDLVDVLGRFDPKLVKMCPSGERAED